MNAVKIIRNIAAIIVGLIVYVVSTVLVSVIVGFMANIPIIGSFIFYPVETSWAAIVIANVMPVGFGAMAAHFVQPKESDWGVKVYGILLLIVGIFVLAVSLKTGQSVWPAIVTGATGLFAAVEL